MPIVLLPVRVKAILGSGVGPSVYENDQSRSAGILEVAMRVMVV